MRPTLPRLHAFQGLGEDGDFVKIRVPRRRRSCPGAAKGPEWAAGTRRHRRDYSHSVAHRAKEEVSSRVAASPRRIGSADSSSRLGSWSRVAPRLPQKTLNSRIYLTRLNKPAAQSLYRSSRIFVISARRARCAWSPVRSRVWNGSSDTL